MRSINPYDLGPPESEDAKSGKVTFSDSVEYQRRDGSRRVIEFTVTIEGCGEYNADDELELFDVEVHYDFKRLVDSEDMKAVITEESSLLDEYENALKDAIRFS